jgi:hypothetical protein
MPDPGSEFFHPGSRIKVKKIADPEPHKRIKVILTQKNVFKLSKKMILDVHPGSRIRIPDSDPGSRGQKSSGSRIRIRNTGCELLDPVLFRQIR